MNDLVCCSTVGLVMEKTGHRISCNRIMFVALKVIVDTNPNIHIEYMHGSINREGMHRITDTVAMFKRLYRGQHLVSFLQYGKRLGQKYQRQMHEYM